MSKDSPGLLGLPHRSLRDNALFANSLITLHYLHRGSGRWPVRS